MPRKSPRLFILEHWAIFFTSYNGRPCMIIDAAPVTSIMCYLVTMGRWRGLDLNSGHTQDPTQATHQAMVRVLLFMIHKCWSRSSLGPGPAWPDAGLNLSCQGVHYVQDKHRLFSFHTVLGFRGQDKIFIKQKWFPDML